MSGLQAVALFMERHGLLLVTAESCTAGLIAAHLADVPGAGGLLDCAFVVYSPEAKKQCLGVSEQTLQVHNLTSEQVAREMAAGALANSERANMAIANTGLADDTDKDVPAGTQCFAWAFRLAKPVDCEQSRLALFSETRRFQGDRSQIREASAYYALESVPRYFEQLTRR
ncbi:MAG TPA: nicotinamide-nucleotide amidohydrolase family protein [Pusillimonas sp.]|uniref:CinA family protein n=1 Tax=Pusillimonas sp. TaxID=3040095 RepID=UPI002C2C80DC|nr:nicotinamide-nucleotide amidohydrolase family protein [Pusillimonas sp.]HUH87772.1 nicotinamide-nucleotide amidohydrolase family protein [Pusillimonas sp.]